MADAFIELQTQDTRRPWPCGMAGADARSRSGAPRQASGSKAGCACESAPRQASIEDVDYRHARRLGQRLFQAAAACAGSPSHRNLFVTGPCGVGKSWLSWRAGTEGLP